MEALLLSLDVGLLIAAFVWAIRNSGSDGHVTGLFRYKSRLSGGSLAAPQAASGKPASR